MVTTTLLVKKPPRGAKVGAGTAADDAKVIATNPIKLSAFANRSLPSIVLLRFTDANEPCFFEEVS